MLGDYGHVGLLFIVAILFPLGGIFASWLFGKLRLRPNNPDPVKTDVYECGIPTEGTAWVQFNFRYYLFALIFVVFDVEVLFLYPWAVAFDDLGVAGFVAAMIFVLVLTLGLVYDWAKGGLEWM